MATLTYAARLHVRANGADYHFVVPGYWPEPDDGCPADSVVDFYFTEGNGSCDCNLSTYLNLYADDRFPVTEKCAETFEVVKVERIDIPDMASFANQCRRKTP